MSAEEPEPQEASQRPTDNRQWQFSLRSLLVLMTVWAVFLSVSAVVPGLEGLPYIIGILAVLNGVRFGLGCLLGWIIERGTREHR